MAKMIRIAKITTCIIAVSSLLSSCELFGGGDDDHDKEREDGTVAAGRPFYF